MLGFFLHDCVQNTDYVNWLPYANNHTQERHPCEGGTEEVVYSTVYYKKSNTWDVYLHFVTFLFCVCCIGGSCADRLCHAGSCRRTPIPVTTRVWFTSVFQVKLGKYLQIHRMIICMQRLECKPFWSLFQKPTAEFFIARASKHVALCST